TAGPGGSHSRTPRRPDPQTRYRSTRRRPRRTLRSPSTAPVGSARPTGQGARPGENRPPTRRRRRGGRRGRSSSPPPPATRRPRPGGSRGAPARPSPALPGPPPPPAIPVGVGQPDGGVAQRGQDAAARAEQQHPLAHVSRGRRGANAPEPQPAEPEGEQRPG